MTSVPGQNVNPLAGLGSLPTPGNMKRGQIPNMSNMPNMADISAMMTNIMGTMAAGTMGRSVTSLSFSPDGKTLASGGVESKSNFDMASMMGQATARQKGSKGQKPANPDDFMKDFKIETTGQIVFWNPATGQQVATIRGHGKGVSEVAFSHDGKTIASAATDNTIKLWDVVSQRELRTLTGHIANIESMDFSPDGKLLASASDDGSTFLWDTTTGEHLLTLISLDDGAEWMVITPDGLFDGTPQSWNQILWRYNQDTFNVAPVEWFFNEFYHPGLLSDIFAGKRPRVAQDISKKDRRQPIVKLSLGGNASPDTVATRTVKVRIDVTDAPADTDHTSGSGARDLRLFRNGSLIKVWHGDALKGQPAASLQAPPSRLQTVRTAGRTAPKGRENS
jgi:WD40 repeat protein